MRIVLASAQLDLRLALEILLREEPGSDVVGTASDAAILSSLLQASNPDLVILDWDLPGCLTPLHFVAEAAHLCRQPQVSVIVLGRDPASRQEALAAGAEAFVVRGDLPADLLAAIRHSRARHRDAANAA